MKKLSVWSVLVLCPIFSQAQEGGVIEMEEIKKTTISKLSSSSVVLESPYNRIFSGKQRTYTCSPIVSTIDINAEEIDRLCYNPYVEIIKPVKNNTFYKVRYEKGEGYIWAGWIKF